MKLSTYFVETWGCQMNVLDSQRLEGVLHARGLAPVGAAGEADVVLLNTCSVREKAVQKVLSRLGELRALRLESGKPRIVGLCGCVAEQEGARLLSRAAVLDFVVGPGRLAQAGAAIDAVLAGERKVYTGFSPTRDYDAHLIARGDGARQYVTAIHGCNQHCTFCIVPYTRGHELSRPLGEIVDEVRSLAVNGAKEITLLGQTINAYRCPRTGADFGDLLLAVDDIPQLWRLQFITSHPIFFSDNMIRKIAATRKTGSYLHVPFQAGSDSILKAMHRGYSRTEYLGLVDRLRGAIPRLTLSTDVIVGFPGESEADFEQTLDLVERVRFGQLFGFAYSPRPRTPAARYPDHVSQSISAQRLARLFAVHGPIQFELNQSRIGREVEILVDGPAKRGADVWQGRGDDNRVVNVAGWPGIAVGHVATVRVTGASAHALFGELSAARGTERQPAA